MATPQHKIGSGFGQRSTAVEVLRGIDLSGKLAIITGGYSGIGLQTTRALAGAGARVMVPARRPAAAREALAGLDRVEVEELDLADLASVRGFAERFLASGRTVHIVINNAGVMASPQTHVGPGWEAHFAINHIGHYALVNRLWPAIARDGTARVVSVSSAGHRRSPIRWDDIHFTGGYDKLAAYGQSKTANILFAVHLDALAQDFGVRAFAVHPGLILTPVMRHMSPRETAAAGWTDEQGNAVGSLAKTPEQGAATQTWAATAPQLAGMGGVYCQDCDIAELASTDARGGGVQPYAIDPENAARLWTLSAELTGLSLPDHVA